MTFTPAEVRCLAAADEMIDAEGSPRRIGHKRFGELAKLRQQQRMWEMRRDTVERRHLLVMAQLEGIARRLSELGEPEAARSPSPMRGESLPA